MKTSQVLRGLAVTAPFVIFGLIYGLAVQPQRALERDVAARAQSLRAELTRAETVAPETPAIHNAAQRKFERLVPVEDRSSEVVDALGRLLKNSTGGSVANVSIDAGDVVRPSRGALESRIQSFDGPIAYRPLTVTFDARTAQLTQFLSRLRTMPTIVELRGLEIAPASSGPLMRTRLLLFVYQRAEVGAPSVPAPAPQPVAPLVTDARPAVESARKPTAPAPKPDPVVHTILFSSQHKVALVDGHIVREGDRLGSGQVQAIERDSVVFVTADGVVKRLVLDQHRITATKR